MKLTKNEKRVLNLLIENARISDSAIAEKLKISSQAIGKLRRKLEENLKISYSLDLDYTKIGLQVFAISLARMTLEGLHKGDLEIEQKLNSEPHVINVYRVPNQNITHIILYGFQSIEDLDNFFYSHKNKRDLFEFIENQQLFTFSNHSLIKKNPSQIFKKLIDSLEKNEKRSDFKEIENFKKKLK